MSSELNHTPEWFWVYFLLSCFFISDLPPASSVQPPTLGWGAAGRQCPGGGPIWLALIDFPCPLTSGCVQPMWSSSMDSREVGDRGYCVCFPGSRDLSSIPVKTAALNRQSCLLRSLPVGPADHSISTRSAWGVFLAATSFPRSPRAWTPLTQESASYKVLLWPSSPR